MKNIKVILVALLLGALNFADAQYYYPGPPPPPQPRHRERQEKEEPEITQPTGYFQVSIGLAQPVGGFANEFGAGYGGYALPGSNVSISLGLPINHSNFGVALMYSGCSNWFDINTYVNNLQLADQTRQYQGLVQDSYGESFILGGLFATYPIHRILSLDFRLTGGVALCSLPQLDYEASPTSSTAVTNFEWNTSGSSSASFAYDIGGDLRFKLRRISLILGVDYLAANPMVNSIQQYTDQNGNMTLNRVSGSVPISMMSYSLGLGYEIR
jgi:hypothetical protein